MIIPKFIKQMRSLQIRPAYSYQYIELEVGTILQNPVCGAYECLNRFFFFNAVLK